MKDTIQNHILQYIPHHACDTFTNAKNLVKGTEKLQQEEPKLLGN